MGSMSSSSLLHLNGAETQEDRTWTPSVSSNSDFVTSYLNRDNLNFLDWEFDPEQEQSDDFSVVTIEADHQGFFGQPGFSVAEHYYDYADLGLGLETADTATAVDESQSASVQAVEFRWSQTLEPCGNWNCPFEETTSDSPAKVEECFICVQRIPGRGMLRCGSCEKGVCVICLMRVLANDEIGLRCPFCRAQSTPIAEDQLLLYYRAHKKEIPIRRLKRQSDTAHHQLIPSEFVAGADDPIYATIRYSRDLLSSWDRTESFIGGLPSFFASAESQAEDRSFPFHQFPITATSSTESNSTTAPDSQSRAFDFQSDHWCDQNPTQIQDSYEMMIERIDNLSARIAEELRDTSQWDTVLPSSMSSYSFLENQPPVGAQFNIGVINPQCAESLPALNEILPNEMISGLVTEEDEKTDSTQTNCSEKSEMDQPLSLMGVPSETKRLSKSPFRKATELIFDSS